MCARVCVCVVSRGLARGPRLKIGFLEFRFLGILNSRVKTDLLWKCQYTGVSSFLRSCVKKWVL